MGKSLLDIAMSYQNMDILGFLKKHLADTPKDLSQKKKKCIQMAN